MDVTKLFAPETISYIADWCTIIGLVLGGGAIAIYFTRKNMSQHNAGKGSMGIQNEGYAGQANQSDVHFTVNTKHATFGAGVTGVSLARSEEQAKSRGPSKNKGEGAKK